jgi:hypothetical protein
MVRAKVHAQRAMTTDFLGLIFCSTADEKLVAAVCNTANPRRYSFESFFHTPNRKTVNPIVFCRVLGEKGSLFIIVNAFLEFHFTRIKQITYCLCQSFVFYTPNLKLCLKSAMRLH